MKTLALLVSVLALTVGEAQAQAPSASRSRLPDAVDTQAAGGLQSLKLLDGNLPGFPYDLMQVGVREGEARIAFTVDPEGRVEDCLAVYYTHPEFGQVGAAAVRRWRFHPARFNGQPVAAASEVTIRFEVQGTIVVSLTPSDVVNARLYSMTELGREAYRPRLLKELDRIPTPISAPSPVFPSQIAGGRVTVSFYIDETGTVRLPSVEATDSPELGAAAIAAIRTWKFEPPTCKGQPVLVRASQQFNFRQRTPAVAGARAS